MQGFEATSALGDQVPELQAHEGADLEWQQDPVAPILRHPHHHRQKDERCGLHQLQGAPEE